MPTYTNLEFYSVVYLSGFIISYIILYFCLPKSDWCKWDIFFLSLLSWLMVGWICFAGLMIFGAYLFGKDTLARKLFPEEFEEDER